MKAARFDYVRPGAVGEAVAALVQGRGGAKLIAGGQSLGPMLNLRLARPSLLVDVARLDALRQVEDIGGAWRIGAAVTHARIEDARDKLSGAVMLCDVAAGVAYRAIRNRGTIGGSLAHADPAGDWAVVLAALGASVNVRGPRGGRSVPVDGFIQGAFTTVLGEDELIETIDVPKLSRAARCGYYKFCRKTGEFAEASAAVIFEPESSIARLFLGAVRGAPRSLSALAQRVAQEGERAASSDAVAQAVAQAVPDLDPFERRMAGAVVTRALRRALTP